MIYLYTDGSSSKNRCGWGVFGVRDGKELTRIQGVTRNVTNQRMELRAVLEALRYWDSMYPDEDCTICSDSAYFCNCYFEKWYVNWLANNWLNSKQLPVANQDLWEKIIPYFDNPRIHVEKVKGHSGHTYNEIADKLATGTLKVDDLHLKIDEKNDKINIELSEILLDYSLKKYSVDETIRRIRKACNCE